MLRLSLQASSPAYSGSNLYSPDSSANSGPIISDVTELAQSSPSASPSDSLDERSSPVVRIKEEPPPARSPQIEEASPGNPPAEETPLSPSTFIDSILPPLGTGGALRWHQPCVTNPGSIMCARDSTVTLQGLMQVTWDNDLVGPSCRSSLCRPQLMEVTLDTDSLMEVTLDTDSVGPSCRSSVSHPQLMEVTWDTDHPAAGYRARNPRASICCRNRGVYQQFACPRASGKESPESVCRLRVGRTHRWGASGTLGTQRHSPAPLLGGFALHGSIESLQSLPSIDLPALLFLLPRNELNDHLDTIDSNLDNLQTMLTTHGFSVDTSALLDLFSPSMTVTDMNLPDLDSSLASIQDLLSSQEQQKPAETEPGAPPAGKQLVHYTAQPLFLVDSSAVDVGGGDLPIFFELGEGPYFTDGDEYAEDPTISLLSGTEQPKPKDPAIS
nr:heat shock factor protein 1-like [Columba livia]